MGHLLLAIAALAAQMPDQPARGAKIFFKSTKGIACTTCHELEGKGTPAGPDLRNVASVGPRGIVLAIVAPGTAFVQEVELVGGRRITFMPRRETPEEMAGYDLTGRKPAALTLKKANVRNVRSNVGWKHPPESTGYTDQELADLVAYIKFAARGTVEKVTPDDVRR